MRPADSLGHRMLLIGGEILAALRQKIHSRYRPNLRGHLFYHKFNPMDGLEQKASVQFAKPTVDR